MASGTKRRLRAVVVVLTMSGIVAGCDAEPPKDDATVRLKPGTNTTQTRAQVGVPYAEYRQLSMATEKLIQKCMAAAGFRYTMKPVSERPASSTWRRGDDVARARTEGYGAITVLREQGSNANLGQAAKPPPDPDTDSLSESERRRFIRTLNGTRREEIKTFGGGVLTFGMDGCQAKAFAQLYGDVRQYVSVSVLADNLEGLAQAGGDQSPEHRAAVRNWSSCVAAKGYRFADQAAAREAAFKLYRGETLPERPLRREIEQAVADAECDRAAGLSRLENSLYEKNLKESIKKYEAELLAYHDMQRRALKRAAAVLK